MIRAAGLAMIVSACFFAAPAAEAAFPGANGKVAFVRDIGSGNAIFTINADGSGLSGPLTSNSFGDQDPAWSADGTRIVFTRNLDNRPSTGTQVWVMNADGSGQAQLTSGDGDCEPYFLPDGRIVFIRAAMFCPDDGDLFIRSLNGSQTLVHSHAPGANDSNPTASVDNQTIAFAEGDNSDRLIYTVSAGGGAAAPITNDHGMNSVSDDHPNFSPNGTTVAFDRCAASTDGCDGSIAPGPLNLMTVPAGGGTVSALTANTDENGPYDCEPAYAPEGSSIVFSHEVPGTPITSCDQNPSVRATSGIAFIGSSGGAIQQSVAGFAPDWQPVAVAAAGGGAGAPAGSTPPRTGRCRGVKATILGTNGNDRIIGTKHRDVVQGFKGRDLIKGLRGNDLLCGARGRDRIFGNKGNDVLIGGKHSDYLNGGPGKDRLYGGTPKAPIQHFRNVCVASPLDVLSNCQVVK